MRILVTGGSGTLGTALRRLRPEWLYPFSWQFNVLSPLEAPEPRPDAIVHCAAYTDVAKAENGSANLAFALNVNGTKHVAQLGIPLVYISTEYVFRGDEGSYAEDAHHWPVNWYGKTKTMGEIAACEAPSVLTIRTLFKPEPFPHERACVDQWTSGDSVSVIAPMIVRCVEAFVRGEFARYDSIHVGTEKKSTFDLARKTRESVLPCLREAIAVPLPRDTSLDCSKYRRMFGEG